MSAAVGLSLVDQRFTLTGTVFADTTVSVGTSAEAIPLGEITGPHWAFLMNRDATNFVRVRNGSTGADLIKLKALEFALFPFYDSAVPFWIADTAACICRALVFQL